MTQPNPPRPTKHTPNIANQNPSKTNIILHNKLGLSCAKLSSDSALLKSDLTMPAMLNAYAYLGSQKLQFMIYNKLGVGWGQP